MNKREFLDALSRALTGKVEASEVSQHISYYSDYIDKEIRLGKSEEEVIRNLGDPRLLVKSIVNAENAASERMGWGSRNAEYSYETVDDASNGDDDRRTYGNTNSPKVIPWWLILLIIVLVIFAMIISLLSAVGSLLTLLFGRYLTPIVILLLIWWMYSRYRR